MLYNLRNIMWDNLTNVVCFVALIYYVNFLQIYYNHNITIIPCL